jgi:hypothetical protein
MRSYCLMIDAAAAGWCDKQDYKDWVEKSDAAHWPEDAGGDIFTTWDHGEGCDNPEPMEPGPGIMPMWLWEEIAKVVTDANLADEYVSIRLMGA